MLTAAAWVPPDHVTRRVHAKADCREVGVRSIHLHHVNQFRRCSTTPIVSLELAAPELRRSIHRGWMQVQDEFMALPALAAEEVQMQTKKSGGWVPLIVQDGRTGIAPL